MIQKGRGIVAKSVWKPTATSNVVAACLGADVVAEIAHDHPRAAVGERGDEEDVREAAQAADRRLSSRAASASRGRACGASPPWAPPPRGSRPGSGCGGNSRGGTPRRGRTP